MIKAADRRFMGRALSLAELGWGRVAPNPMVGAVIVKNGVIVGEGYHAEYGAHHAETVALRAAGVHASGSTLYVNLEPCAHHGRTPPCTEAIIDAQLARVVIAVRDPNPAAAGGAERLAAAGIEVEFDVRREAALELNAPFFNRFRAARPWVILKLAMSLDGGIADRARSRGWITSEESRKVVHRMRAGVDAVAVGLGTVIADDPELTVRHAPQPRVAPARIVFSGTGALPSDARLVRSSGSVPTWLITGPGTARGAGELEALGVRVVSADDTPAALRFLAEKGIHSILVEGGAALACSLLNEALVDRLTIFRAPILLGEGALHGLAHVRSSLVSEASRLPVVATRMIGDDVMTTFALTSL